MKRIFRIVVVEDSATQAFKLRLLLEEEGWQVSVAGTAETALAALGAPLPDLIVVDYNLPGMRGDEFCRRIRMNLNTRGIPILMMTASSPDTAEISSLESGADDYLSKLESPEILLLRIRALLRKAPAQPAILNPQDSDFRPARVLAIDDGPIYLAFLGAELRTQGYEVETADSGPEGLSRLVDQRFDCVLVDMTMAGMDGIEVCRQIVAMPQGLNSGVAIIILTGSEDEGALNRGLEAGADDFVGKSRDLAVLRARIQVLMRRRFFREENSRIVEEFKTRELETLHARAGREVAEARAAIAEELVQANHDLQEANRKLKETQAQLIHNEKMASLGQLVAGIAHEINNPLAFIVNNLFLVESGLNGLWPEMEGRFPEPSLLKMRKARDRLGEMGEGLNRVKELVLDLRTFSRLDEGEFKTVDIVEMIDAVLLLLKHEMNSRIHVEKHYAPGRTLYCYAGRLHQVLMNLIANAVDAIVGEGAIIVTTSQTSELFLISVRDSGTGIAETNRSKILDPFFTTKPIGKGTGLGLSISYGIVRDHGGSIEMQSEEGVGTEFIVKIPLDLESKEGKMKEKLLVLDDESLILTSLEHLFEDDFEVFTTTSAETALRLAREHDIAVILCDERMAGVSGHEFLGRVREVSRATRVMMSGYADISALTEAVNSGQIFAYIAKPWESLKLKAKIAAAAVHFKLVQEVDQERVLLRALMENIPDPIYFKDRQSRFTRVNEAHARALGANNPGECIGRSDADYFKSEDALRWRLEEEEIVKSGQSQADRIERIENPQGALRWMSRTKVPMFNRAGQVSGIAGISRDITALKKGEEMLREQNEHNRMILETANDAFIAMDPDGTITAWNPRAESTFGWTAAEAMGRRWYDIVIAPAYREAHTQGVEHFLATTQGSLSNRPIELVALRRDGREFPAEATVWPVRAGGAFSFNAFVRDISERRRAEEARKNEAALVQLLQSVTVSANRSSTIEHAAQTCLDRICAHTGWPVGHVFLRAKSSPEELISAGLWHVKDDRRFAAFREAGDRCRFGHGEGMPGRVLASGKPEWIVDLADERLFLQRSRAAGQAGLRSGFCFPVVVEEKTMAVLEFFSLQTVEPDEAFLTMMEQIGTQLGQVIIRQRAAEDLRRAKASAEFANRAKSEFLTTMSHEMRTPMNAILGMADLLSEGSLREEQRHYVDIFQKAGANLLNLINDILDLSKVESGHFELESIGFNLGALLEKIVEMMASRAHDRGLQLTLDLLPGVASDLVGDPNRLRQILINLVGNALKFTEWGSVAVRVEPDPGGAAGWLRFSVVDTGIGIAADKTEMIFDRFTQADSSTTRKYGGTGLGLAISRALAELMGGRIECTSEVGKGSTFSLTAPFGVRKEVETPALAEPAAIAIPPAEPAGRQPVSRILIAEDSESNIVLINAYLKDCGFELDFAENGKIAVEKVMAGKTHLVLMDIQMPVMDGLEATRAIRQWEAKTHSHPIPILALTAHAAGEGAGSSLNAGCTEHLTKPIKKATLLAAISRYIGGKIRITPPEGIEGLVPQYLANVRRDMGEILKGVDEKDCTIARRLGHQFKGSGEGYGFPEITRAGAAVELAAIAANENGIRSQILALATYLDRVEIVV